MTRIALGYDGSEAARAAAGWVSVRAPRDTAAVDIVTVTGIRAFDDERVEESLDQARRMILDHAPGLVIESHTVDGRMPNALGEDSRRADLIVVGIRTGRPVRSGGSTILRLTARAHGPVCVVPDVWAPSDDPVTVGIGPDDSADAALLFAANEAAAADVPLHIVHAWRSPDGRTAASSARREHRAVLDVASARVHAHNPSLRVEAELVAENPTAALLHRAPQSSLIVIGTHRRGVLAGGMLGSVAQDVIGQSAAPVTVVPNSPPR